ncbi:MAG: hypothetical protein AVDCRST_MAG35-1156 [uncultured Quadrisphaera sp.]|uniref:N-acetyltransferase domain-containing protein n=1 Tax=uncultured Quadrisphaera sp. TaxID=904978 RepID=A0A6J4PAY1_9ACTN|nr:MAG: hypothetical protein AVDCRST_MAG35-1156 [uncultured Quadrisphaera sp.]
MERADASQTADLHLRNLSMGLFPQLGHRFMTRWHQTFAGSEHAWGGVVVGPGGQVVAVALVTTDQPAHTAEILREHRTALLRAGTAGLVRHPRALVTFLRTRVLRYLRRIVRGGRPDTPPSARSEPREIVGVVHVLVTAEQVRERGLAAALLGAAESWARQRGTTVLALVTDYPEQPAAHTAADVYDRLGWERTAVRHRDGRRIAEYRRHLVADAAGGDESRSTSG